MYLKFYECFNIIILFFFFNDLIFLLDDEGKIK